MAIKKDKMLVLTNECFETVSANGICLDNILEELDAKKIGCDVLTFGQEDKEVMHGENLRVVYLRNTLFTSQNPICSIIQRVVNKFTYELVSPDINIIYFHKYYKQAVKLIEENSYGAILASSGGFFSQIVALKLAQKYKDIKIMPIFLDPPITINFLYKKNRPYYRKMVQYEKKLFEISDAILLESNLYLAMREQYREDNLCEIGIPLVKKRYEDNESVAYDSKQILFMGTLWKSIRNPEYTLKLLANFQEFSVSFYGGNATKMVLEEYDLTNAAYKGCLEHTEVSEMIKKSGYLLNISNVNIVQTPSKIYEYISYGKPIINIVKSPHDKTIELIKRYGNGISLLEGEAANIGMLTEFLEKQIQIKEYKEITEEFRLNTPEYVASIILKNL